MIVYSKKLLFYYNLNIIADALMNDVLHFKDTFSAYSNS